VQPSTAQRRLLPVLTAALLAAATVATATIAPAAAAAAADRDRTVGVISAGSDPESIRIVTDLASALDDTSFHVLPIVGRGPAQTVTDLARLEGADAGIVPSDVLPYLQREGRLEAADRSDRPLRYVGKLYQEELHVLARRDIPSIADLAGRKVGVGVLGSGSSITASLVFGALNIGVQPVFLDPAAALVQLRRGEIAALVLVARKPAPLFFALNRQDDGVHFLPVPITPALPAMYRPARLGIEDYPLLVGAGEAGRGTPIDTVAVPEVLAVRDWAPGSARYADVSRLVDALFQRVPALRTPGRDPAWQELDLSADIPGWSRFAPAQARLNGEETAATRTMSGTSVAPPPAPRRSTLSKKHQEALFREFLRWQQGQQASGQYAPAGPEGLFEQFLRWRGGQR
jgi:uncharacterized protein